VKVLVGTLGESSEVMSRNVECLQKWTVAFEYDQRFSAGSTTPVVGVETLIAPVTLITSTPVPVPIVPSIVPVGIVTSMSPVFGNDDDITMCVPSSFVMTDEDVTEFLKSLNEAFSCIFTDYVFMWLLIALWLNFSETIMVGALKA